MSHLNGCAPGRLGLARDDRGATAVEYALMAALIAVVIAVAVGAFGAALNSLFVIPAGVLP